MMMMMMMMMMMWGFLALTTTTTRVFMSSIVFILFIYPRISGYVLRIVVELHFADLAV